MTVPHDDLLTRFLADSDARCPSCRYSLRSCQSQKCPECGTTLELALRSRATSAWWNAGVIGLALAIMLLALLLSSSLPSTSRIAAQKQVNQLVQMGMTPPSDLIGWSMIFKIAISLCAGVILLGWLIASRRRFAQWNSAAQAAIGLAGAISPLVAIALLWALARG